MSDNFSSLRQTIKPPLLMGHTSPIRYYSLGSATAGSCISNARNVTLFTFEAINYFRRRLHKFTTCVLSNVLFCMTIKYV